MSREAPTFAHGAFTASAFTLNAGSSTALTATLALYKTNNSGITLGSSNVIKVSVNSTPAMITLLQPTSGWSVQVNGNAVTLTVKGVTIAPAKGNSNVPDANFDFFAVYPLPVPAGISIGRVNDGHLFDLSYPDIQNAPFNAALTWRYRNCLKTGPNSWQFAVSFIGSDGNTYTWDPTEEADH